MSKGRHICKFCGQDYDNYYDWVDHMREEHRDE